MGVTQAVWKSMSRGWFSVWSRRTSDINRRVAARGKLRLSISFQATSRPEFLSYALYTVLKAPDPSSSSSCNAHPPATL